MSQNDQNPLVSIIMATQNRADLLLQRSIPSVLGQTYDNWELIIGGDGAGRDTELVISSFGDKRIRFVNLPRQEYSDEREQSCIGGTNAINNALDLAQGKYIAHLDDDDEYLPKHIETLLNLLENGSFDIVYGRSYFERLSGWIEFGEPFDQEKLSSENYLVHSAVMYSKKKLGHFRYPTSGFEPADWVMWKRMAAEGAKFGFTSDIVCLHYAESYARRRKGESVLQIIFNEYLEKGVTGILRRAKEMGIQKILKVLITRRHRTDTKIADIQTRRSQNEVDPNQLMLNIGSGVEKKILGGWINIDLLHGADLRLDARKRLPFEDISVDFIYNEHFIEHLSAEEGCQFFQECFRVLKKGGVLRTATPDLKYALERYLDDWSDQTWLRDYSFSTASEMLNATFYSWGHKFLYDETTLHLYLEASGFRSIERCGLGQSKHSELSLLETRPESRLIIEAKK